ncbi:MAG: MscL family protein [Promethearchaeota archaeon]
MSQDEQILEELQRIREALEPKPDPPRKLPKNLAEEFKEFLMKYKVMGLAVAFIMGLYLGSLIKALVTDLIMPIIEIILPGIEWELLQLGPFAIGHFIGELMTFLIVAFVIFLIVKLTTRMGIE